MYLRLGTVNTNMDTYRSTFIRETKPTCIYIDYTHTCICRHMLACAHIHFFFFFRFLGPHLRHMEFPKLEVESELQLPAYTTATVTQDPSHICDLHHSSRQRWISPLSKARDQTCILMDTRGIVSATEQWELLLLFKHMQVYA